VYTALFRFNQPHLSPGEAYIPSQTTGPDHHTHAPNCTNFPGPGVASSPRPRPSTYRIPVLLLSCDADGGLPQSLIRPLLSPLTLRSLFRPLLSFLWGVPRTGRIQIKGYEKWVKMTFFIGLPSLPDKPVSRPMI